jgi:hypothetical protein
MEQSSDRNRRRRATLVAAAAPSSSSGARLQQHRVRKPAARAPAPPSIRAAARAPVRVAPVQRWRPRLKLVASNASPRPAGPRPRPHLRLLPPLAPLPRPLAWRATTLAAVDVDAQNRRRTAQALLLATVAAAGLAALASSLGRLLG